jgi:TonB family protein
MLQRVNPIYPQAAAASRAAGDVTMSATVGADGKVKGIKVLSGHPLLRDAAVRAFQQWRYSPSTVNGHPVDSPITVTVSFKRSE